jgi:uncharacterized protein YoxC
MLAPSAASDSKPPPKPRSPSPPHLGRSTATGSSAAAAAAASKPKTECDAPPIDDLQAIAEHLLTAPVPVASSTGSHQKPSPTAASCPKPPPKHTADPNPTIDRNRYSKTDLLFEVDPKPAPTAKSGSRRQPKPDPERKILTFPEVKARFCSVDSVKVKTARLVVDGNTKSIDATTVAQTTSRVAGRLQNTETHVGRLESASDVRFDEVCNRFEALLSRFDEVRTQIQAVADAQHGFDAKLDAVAVGLDAKIQKVGDAQDELAAKVQEVARGVDRKMREVDSKMDGLEGRFNEVAKKTIKRAVRSKRKQMQPVINVVRGLNTGMAEMTSHIDDMKSVMGQALSVLTAMESESDSPEQDSD